MEVAVLLLVLTNALTKATDVLVDSVTPSLRTSHPLLPRRGCTALSFLLSRVGPTPLWSVILHGSGTGRCGSPHYGHPSGLPSGGTEGDGWGDGVTPEAVKELRRATNLALRAIKHTAQTVGCNMAGLVAVERLLWLNLTEIREKEKVFLLDTQVSSSGLFDLTPSSISSGLLKCSWLRLSSSRHDVHVNQPLPLPRPPGSTQPPERSQSVEWAIQCIPHHTRSGEPVVVPLLASALTSG